MKRVLPFGCPIVAALLVVLVAPPSKLVAFVGSDLWARLGLWVLVTVILYMGLIGLGLAAGKVGLPFGLSLEQQAPGIGIDALAADLKALREADERVFERLGRLAALLEQNAERVTLLERRVGVRRPHDEGGAST